MEGEVLFADYATEQELQDAFPEREAAVAAELIQQRLDKLKSVFKDYIESKYDSDVQSILNAVAIQTIVKYISGNITLIDAKPIMNTAMAVPLWIRSIVKQFYIYREEILAGNIPDVDFSIFNNTDPNINIAAFLNSL